jgi:hypothetical protein
MTTGWKSVSSSKRHFIKQPKTAIDDAANDEVFISEALTLVTYAQADLEQITRNCSDLTANQQASLLQVLRDQKAYFSVIAEIGRIGPL